MTLLKFELRFKKELLVISELNDEGYVENVLQKSMRLAKSTMTDRYTPEAIL
jgi:hypothetical protein